VKTLKRTPQKDYPIRFNGEVLSRKKPRSGARRQLEGELSFEAEVEQDAEELDATSLLWKRICEGPDYQPVFERVLKMWIGHHDHRPSQADIEAGAAYSGETDL